MYTSFGMSSAGVEKMYTSIPSKTDEASEGITQQRAHLGTGIQKEQLHGGPHLEDLTATYMAHIEQQVDWRNLPHKRMVRSSSDEKVVSLQSLCGEVLGIATMHAFYGKPLLELAHGYLDLFLTFDSNSWMLMYQYPRAFAKAMYEARDRGTEIFTRYSELTPEERREACQYVRNVEEKSRKAGMTVRDIAIANQTFFWAAFNTILLDSIRREVAPGISHGNIDVQYLVNKCSLLDASFNEILRLTNAATSARTVKEDILIGDRYLRANSKVLISFRQLHYAEEFFGPDVADSNPSRFLENDNLRRSPFFRPFGRGNNILFRQVPGEESDKDKGLPKLDRTKPTLGTMDPVGEGDVLLRVKSNAK
ncbi:MAG: hypothetical protein M1837_000840 [Sclerophora amabilis]|nr:MAG: hypothetical protein M1837_000840 [Sclerophora amabilis]